MEERERAEVTVWRSLLLVYGSSGKVRSHQSPALGTCVCSVCFCFHARATLHSQNQCIQKKKDGERKGQRKRLPVNTRGTHSLLSAVSQHFLNPLVKQKAQHFARKHEDIPIIRIRTRHAVCWAEYIKQSKF